jgi:putative hydrolase of the HAD superfamily
MPTVRAVAFDAVGTLIHPDPPVAVVYADVGRRYGSTLSAADLAPRFRASFAEREAADRAAGWRTDEAGEYERWRGIVTSIFADLSPVAAAAAFADLWAHFARPDCWRADPDAAPLLAGLAARGVRLAVASNFDARLRGVLAGLPGLSDFGVVVVSSEVGWRKPAGAFFAALVGGLDAAPGQVLLVGDDLENDHDGATAAGLRAVLLDPRGRAPAGLPRVARLADVAGFLGPD